MEGEIQSLYWMGTWQNVDILPTPELFDSKHRTLKYMIYQKEKAPSTGKLHFQCYLIPEKDEKKHSFMKPIPTLLLG